eukprot:CAMPEP_0169248954 /NCGR_PEP_ID=MMETSP1016-20121227/36141_1 /TAXON_ID=342587 /ORGANISM="Karlodinium micrum, Strain CCMP2283" /LENGTH=179 /DNA_ID=CAMNT_0009329831 /DNA_START=89 /DNA_END=623 /DNA_ORIENTATION=-
MASLYGQVFSKGFARGWTGGLFPATAAFLKMKRLPALSRRLNLCGSLGDLVSAFTYCAMFFLATAGLRMFCKPCTSAIEAVTGTSNGMTQAAGDFSGNVVSACMTAPIHQLYGFVATTPELRTASRKETSERMTKFLKDQYLVTEGGKTRLSSTVPRDLSMRSFYVATLYTMYVTLERA